MTRTAFDAYHTAGILTADPVTLTTLLYDGALKAMRKARLHFENNNRAGFLDEAGRAELIIGELLATLDMSQGEIPKTLSGVYAYCIRCIIDSTLGDMTKMDDAEKHIRRIAEAWKTATAELKRTTADSNATAEAAA